MIHHDDSAVSSKHEDEEHFAFGEVRVIVSFILTYVLFLLVCIKESINFPAIKSFQHCFGVLIFFLYFVFFFRYLFTNAFIPLNIVLVASPILRRIYDYGH